MCHIATWIPPPFWCGHAGLLFARGERVPALGYSPSSAFAVLIDEALGAVLAPVLRREVICEALEAAELDVIPSEATGLRVFVEGALFSTLTRHLEVRDALELIAQIRATLELALGAAPEEPPRSDIRARLTMPAPPSTTLVVTNASLVVFLLADMLGDGVDVVPVSRHAELRERLRHTGGAPQLVVIDRKHAAVDVSVCALLREELDGRSCVVWWGASAAERTMASAFLTGGPRLIPCEPTVGLADLGELCRTLLVA